MRNRALWQGDPAAPNLFNISLDLTATRFCKIAERRKWGYPLRKSWENTYICLLLFADNYWIIATSPQELQDANDCWQSMLKEDGWFTPPGELRYCTTAQYDEFRAEIRSEGKPIERVSRRTGFKALGTQITFNNRNDVELDRRIRAAWGAFHKNANVLCCKAANLGRRLQFLQRIVHPVELELEK